MTRNSLQTAPTALTAAAPKVRARIRKPARPRKAPRPKKPPRPRRPPKPRRPLRPQNPLKPQNPPQPQQLPCLPPTPRHHRLLSRHRHRLPLRRRRHHHLLRHHRHRLLITVRGIMSPSYPWADTYLSLSVKKSIKIRPWIHCTDHGLFFALYSNSFLSCPI